MTKNKRKYHKNCNDSISMINLFMARATTGQHKTVKFASFLLFSIHLATKLDKIQSNSAPELGLRQE